MTKQSHVVKHCLTFFFVIGLFKTTFSMTAESRSRLRSSRESNDLGSLTDLPSQGVLAEQVLEESPSGLETQKPIRELPPGKGDPVKPTVADGAFEFGKSYLVFEGTREQFVTTQIGQVNFEIAARNTESIATVGENGFASWDSKRSSSVSKSTITRRELRTITDMVPNKADTKSIASLKVVQTGSLREEKQRYEESLALKTIQVSNNHNFAGFDGICHNLITSAETWMPKMFAHLFVSSDNNVSVREEKAILATFYPHREEMNGYLDQLKVYPGLIDTLTFLYVPVQVRSLIDAINDLYGRKYPITLKVEALALKNPMVKSYVDRWSSTVVEYQKYASFGSLYYNELSEQVYPILDLQGDGALTDSDVKTSGNFVTKFMRVSKDYNDDLATLNPHICGVLREIIYTFAGEAGHRSKFDASVKMVYESPVEERIEFRVFSTAFLEAFWPTLASDKAKAAKCEGSDPKDKNLQLVEMIFFARTGRLLSEFAELSKSLLAPKSAWHEVLRAVRVSVGSPVKEVADYHHYVLASRFHTAELLVSETLGFRDSAVLFHPEFFQDLLAFDSRFSGKNFGEARVTLDQIQEYMYFDGSDGATTDVDRGFLIYRDIVVNLYKLYVVVGRSGKIKAQSTRKEIWEALCNQVSDKAFFESERDSYADLFPVDTFMPLYYETLTVIGVKGKEAGATECFEPKQPIERLKLRIARPEPVPPPKSTIVVLEWIAKWLLSVSIEGRKTTLKEKLIAIGWNVKKCPLGKFRNFEYTRTTHAALQRSVSDSGDVEKVQKETSRVQVRFTKDCTTEFAVSLEKVIVEFGFKAFKNSPAIPKMHWEIMQILLWVLSTFDVVVRKLAWQVVVQWVLGFRKLPKPLDEDRRLMAILVFQQLEDRVIRKLDYFDTAGLYGAISHLATGPDKPGMGRNNKWTEEQGDNLEKFLPVSMMNPLMLQLDLYYLGYVAAGVTRADLRSSDDQKAFGTNKRYMEESLDFLFQSITYKAKGLKSKVWSLKDMHGKINACHGTLYRSKATKAVVPKFECKKEADCDAADNDYKDCDVDFLLEVAFSLNSMPLLIHSVGVFNVKNYLHPYFRDGENSLRGMRTNFIFAKMIRALQAMRLTLDENVDNPVSAITYAMDRTVQCISPDAIFDKSYDQKERCIFSPRMYADIYWQLKFAYAVQFPHSETDLHFFDPSKPIFGTAQLLALASIQKGVGRAFRTLCEMEQYAAKKPQICILFDSLEFLLQSSSVEARVEDTDVFISFLERLAERTKTPASRARSLMLLLETFETVQVLYGDDSDMANSLREQLNPVSNVDNLSLEQLAEVKQSPLFENFLIGKAETDFKKVLTDYLFFAVNKQKVSPEERGFKSGIMGLGKEVVTAATFKRNPKLKLEMVGMMYGDRTMVETIVNSWVDLHFFLDIASIEYDSDDIKQLIDESAECNHTPDCIYRVFKSEGEEEDLSLTANLMNSPGENQYEPVEQEDQPDCESFPEDCNDREEDSENDFDQFSKEWERRGFEQEVADEYIETQRIETLKVFKFESTEKSTELMFGDEYSSIEGNGINFEVPQGSIIYNQQEKAKLIQSRANSFVKDLNDEELEDDESNGDRQESIFRYDTGAVAYNEDFLEFLEGQIEDPASGYQKHESFGSDTLEAVNNEMLEKIEGVREEATSVTKIYKAFKISKNPVVTKNLEWIEKA